MPALSTLPKHIVITGPTAGIGRAAALSLAEQGSQLTLLCRNLDKGADVSEAIVRAGGLAPHLVHMDMANLDSVRRAATGDLEAKAETVRSTALKTNYLCQCSHPASSHA